MIQVWLEPILPELDYQQVYLSSNIDFKIVYSIFYTFGMVCINEVSPKKTE